MSTFFKIRKEIEHIDTLKIDFIFRNKESLKVVLAIAVLKKIIIPL